MSPRDSALAYSVDELSVTEHTQLGFDYLCRELNLQGAALKLARKLWDEAVDREKRLRQIADVIAPYDTDPANEILDILEQTQ